MFMPFLVTDCLSPSVKKKASVQSCFPPFLDTNFNYKQESYIKGVALLLPPK